MNVFDAMYIKDMFWHRVDIQQPKKVKYSGSEPSTPKKFVLKTLPKAIVKRENNIPLPHPFILPNCYRPDVEEALKSETTRSFLSSAIATFTLYPEKDEYTDVVRVIIEKYPFMKSSIGKPYVSPI